MKTLDEKAFRDILDQVYHLSLKASFANGHVENLNKMLKNDDRIAYDYMKQNSTFLNTVEYGITRSDQNLLDEVRKDLSYYSGGNSEMVQEYTKNREFVRNLLGGHALRREIHERSIGLEETFAEHRFPCEQAGVAAIIHKAEHDKYDVFMDPERIDKELRQELSELIRHEPFQKSKEEIEQDRKALAELKERQAINKALREERETKDYHERKAADEAKEKTYEKMDFKEFDNRIEFYKEFHQKEGFVEAIGDSVTELEYNLEKYHEWFRKGDLERADRYIEEIRFHLSGLCHDVESSGFKEIELKLHSGSYPNDKQEFYSNFLNDTKQVRLTRDQQESSILADRKASDSVYLGTLPEVHKSMKRWKAFMDEHITTIDNLLKDKPSVFEHDGFKKVYEGVKKAEFTCRDHIERTLNDLNVPKVDTNVLEQLDEVNYCSYALKEQGKLAGEYEKEKAKRIQEKEETKPKRNIDFSLER